MVDNSLKIRRLEGTSTRLQVLQYLIVVKFF